MFNIKKTDYGFYMKFAGAMRNQDMKDWMVEAIKNMDSSNGKFALLMDFRACDFLGDKAKETGQQAGDRRQESDQRARLLGEAARVEDDQIDAGGGEVEEIEHGQDGQPGRPGVTFVLAAHVETSLLRRRERRRREVDR